LDVVEGISGMSGQEGRVGVAQLARDFIGHGALQSSSAGGAESWLTH
jgi:hypothetical protein